MSGHKLSPDTQSILLLCGTIGQDRTAYPKPLSPSEYNRLAQWMRSNNIEPGDLLDSTSSDKLKAFQDAKIDFDRLNALLNRGGGLAIAVDEWTQRGIWILSLNDEGYPKRWMDRLNNIVPPLLYGVGNRDLLSNSGIAIVGSRDVDEVAISATRTVAKICAIHDIQIISGGARGVDNEAILTALAQGGRAIGVLADSLAKTSLSGKFRQALRDGRLVLISPYDPDVAFNIGNAMGRNKLVYCLSVCALVINTSLMEGGTWAGAIEDLKHKWVPLFVRDGNNVPEGNRHLIERGGRGFDVFSLEEEDIVKKLIGDSDKVAYAPTEHKPTSSQFTHFKDSDKVDIGSSYEIINDNSFRPALELDLFPIVWPKIEAELRKARTERELAYAFNVQKGQMREWLERAVSSGIARKLKRRPMRYIVDNKSSLNKWMKDN
jgi:predicted Rossmann fold nucleotide-binding protein DprA/Smf involved in DNA uptake